MRGTPFRWDQNVAMMSMVDADGFIGVQPDVYGEQPGMVPFELHHTFGFASRPRDPDVDELDNVEPGGGCTLLIANEGDKGHAWLCADPRVTAVLPSLDKGGSVHYGGDDLVSWFLIEGEDGSVELYVPYAKVAGVASKCMALRFDTTTEAITLQHAEGQTVCMTKAKEIVLAIDNDTHMTLAAGQLTIQAESVIVHGTLSTGNPVTAAPLLAGVASQPSARLLVTPL